MAKKVAKVYEKTQTYMGDLSNMGVFDIRARAGVNMMRQGLKMFCDNLGIWKQNLRAEIKLD